MKHLILSLLFVFSNAFAQEDDGSTEPVEEDGEFTVGDEGPADNGQSVYVPGVILSSPVFSGNGCSPGSVTSVLSFDSKALSILFSSFIAEAGGTTNIRLAKTDCNMLIPFFVPPGVQVRVVKIDYRGYTFIPKKAASRFIAEYNFVDIQTGKNINGNVKRVQGFKGPLDSDYMLSSRIRSRPSWSKCGTNFYLKVKSRVTATTNSHMEQTLATLDSMDMNNDVRFHLDWQLCELRPRRQ